MCESTYGGIEMDRKVDSVPQNYFSTCGHYTPWGAVLGQCGLQRGKSVKRVECDERVAKGCEVLLEEKK